MNALGIGFTCTFLSLAGTVVPSPRAQSVTAVGALSTPIAVIDMDAVGPVGPTTLTAINAAGNPDGGRLAAIVLTGLSGAAAYDTVTTRGRALIRDSAGGLALVDPGAAYQPFEARIAFGLPVVEFGIAVGDYTGLLRLEFRYGGVLVADFVTGGGEARHLVRMEGAVFDRVDVRSEPAGSGFVVQELLVQNAAYWSSLGVGCARASSETLTLVMSGRLTVPLQPDFYLGPIGGGVSGILAIGFSGSTFPGLGALPFDLGAFGAPGCFVRCEIAMSDVVTGSAGHIGYNLAQSTGLTGAPIYAQGYVLDAGANALGVVTSNAVVFVMQ